MKKDVVAIIPARGGSKGISKKNIKLLNDKPLIAYTIEAAKKSKYIDRVIVSTDDREIADISKYYGAEVPFMRPENLAQDTTQGLLVILHFLEWLYHNGYNYKYICQLQCTSPFRTEIHIDEAIEELIAGNGDSIVSMCEVKENPFWMKRIKNNKIVDFINNQEEHFQRQNLPQVYSLNGAIHIAEADILMERKTWYTDNTLPYIMSQETSIDIDDILDFKFAEFMMKEKDNV